ncbi:MAG: sugar ABC transporter permease, partial [Salinibacterium sp.]|nr:sugar ABC transporter permease [Salinibacterium sp.]
MTSRPPIVGQAAARTPRRKRIGHGSALAIFIGPFLFLYVLFYVVPIGYAIYQSFLTVEREGTFGPATTVFGGLVQYIAVFQASDFWASVLRVLLFGIVQVPIMLGLALLFALLLDSPLVKGKKFFR